MTRRAVGRSILALALTFAVTGCGREARERERAEAGRISHAVDGLRQARNADKASWLRALAREPCVFERTCDLKRHCARAYELELQVLDGVRAARTALDDRDGGLAAGALVLASERELARAKDLQRQCVAAQGALRLELKF